MGHDDPEDDVSFKEEDDEDDDDFSSWDLGLMDFFRKYGFGPVETNPDNSTQTNSGGMTMVIISVIVISLVALILNYKN